MNYVDRETCRTSSTLAQADATSSHSVPGVAGGERGAANASLAVVVYEGGMGWWELANGVVGGAVGGVLVSAAQRYFDHRLKRSENRYLERRQHGVDAAKAAIQLLGQMESVVRLDRRAPADSGISVEASNRLNGLGNELGVQVLIIGDKGLRAELQLAQAAISSAWMICHFSGVPEESVVLQFIRHGREVLGAYVRDDAMPERPKHIKQLEKAWEEAEEELLKSQGE